MRLGRRAIEQRPRCRHRRRIGVAFAPSALLRPTRAVIYAVAQTYLPETLRLLRVPRQDVDDMVHAIVEIAYKHLDQYDPGDRDPLQALRGWLGAIAWRHVLTRRGRGHQRFELAVGDVCEAVPTLVTLVTGPGSDAEAASPDLCAAREQRLLIVHRILSGLRQERREVLLLHDALGLTVPEIADELDMKENTVKSRLRRARQDFIAAANRLPPEQRSLLEGSLLALPLGFLLAKQWTSSWSRLPERSAAPERRRERTTVAIAGVAAMLLVGVALGPDASLRASVDAASRPPTIMAVHDAANVGAVTSNTPAAPAPPPKMNAPTAASSARSKSRALTRANTDDPLARETRMLASARHALDRGDYASALGYLEAHAAAFPRSALVGRRERLRSEVAAAMKRAAAQLSR